MAKEKAGAADAMECKVHGPGAEGMGIAGFVEGACWAKDAAGNLSQVWHQTGKNVVVNQGRAKLFNQAFGGLTSSSYGMFGIPYSATTASDRVYSNFSTAVLSNYGSVGDSASCRVPRASLVTDLVLGTWTGTFSYGFFSGNSQVISGVALAWYTTDVMSTGAAAAGVCLYNMGSFAATQQLQSNNTLSVTVTCILSTA